MIEPICSLTDLPVAWCGHCRASAPVEGQLTVLASEHGPRFIAGYPGTCAVCSGHIGPGDEIAALLNDDGYACKDCLP